MTSGMKKGVAIPAADHVVNPSPAAALNVSETGQLPRSERCSDVQIVLEFLGIFELGLGSRLVTCYRERGWITYGHKSHHRIYKLWVGVWQRWYLATNGIPVVGVVETILEGRIFGINNPRMRSTLFRGMFVAIIKLIFYAYTGWKIPFSIVVHSIESLGEMFEESAGS